MRKFVYLSHLDSHVYLTDEFEQPEYCEICGDSDRCLGDFDICDVNELDCLYEMCYLDLDFFVSEFYKFGVSCDILYELVKRKESESELEAISCKNALKFIEHKK